MNKKYYKLNPIYIDEKLYWVMEFEDGTEELIPFNIPHLETIKQLKEKNDLYITNKRLEKINKIIKNYNTN